MTEDKRGFTDEDGFIQSILEAPDDDVPRLQYADWLEEQGDPRGEFIRLQVELARMTANDPRRLRLAERAGVLLKQHRLAWGAPLLDRLSPNDWITSWRRGFPEGIETDAKTFLDHASDIFRLSPVRALTVLPYTPPAVFLQLCTSSHLARLTALDLSWAAIDPTGVQALVSSDSVRNLTELNLSWNAIGPAGANVVAASPHLSRLTKLRLGTANLGLEGVRALLASPQLARLTALSLGGNDIGPAGAAALAASDTVRNLTELDLSWNNIGLEGVQALAASPHLVRLTTMNLKGNSIGPADVRELAASDSLRNLTELDLRDNPISPESAASLVDSPNLPHLTTLWVDGEALQAEVDRRLAARHGAAPGAAARRGGRG